MTLTAGRRSDHDTRVRVDADPARERDGTMGCVQGARPSLRRTATYCSGHGRSRRALCCYAESTLVCAAFLAAGADLNGKGRRVGSNAKETTNV